MTGEPRLTVVIPAYNEADGLEKVVREAADLLAQRVPSSEIVVVDDGSTDATGAIADDLAGSIGRVRVVHNATNRGLGGAMRAGFTAARGAMITSIPGDGQFDLAEVLDHYLPEGPASAVFGYRREPQERRRNLISLIFHTVIRVLFRVDETGYCGVYLLSRDVLVSMPLRSENVFLNLEVFLRYRRLGLPFSTMILTVHPRIAGSSKVSNARTMLRNAVEVVRFRFERK